MHQELRSLAAAAAGMDLTPPERPGARRVVLKDTIPLVKLHYFGLRPSFGFGGLGLWGK